MPRSRKTGKTSTPWYDQWWAGEDLDAVAKGNTSDQKSKSRADREASVRWAAQQRPRGGVIRRMLG